MKEKDLDYIAGLEKAIARKYEDISIQNPSSFWDEEKEERYLQQLKAFVEKQKKQNVLEGNLINQPDLIPQITSFKE